MNDYLFPGNFLWILIHAGASFVGVFLKEEDDSISLWGRRVDMEVVAIPHKVKLLKSWLFLHQPISFIALKRKEDFEEFYEMGNDLKNLTHKEVGIRNFVRWVRKCEKLQLSNSL